MNFRSSDGKILIASSTDGYCSIIHFKEGELGKKYEADTPPVFTNIEKKINKTTNETSPIKTETQAPFIELDNDAMDIDISHCDKSASILTVSAKSDVPENSKPSTKTENDDKILVNGKKIKSNDICEDTEDIKLVYEESNTDNVKTSSKHTPKKIELPSVKTPRRVQLITLSSPKRSKRE